LQEDRDRQIAELNAKSQKLAERLEQREQELIKTVEDLRTQLQVTLGSSCYLLNTYVLFMMDGGWWTWALVSSDRVAPSRMVGVSVSVNLPLHYEVQTFSSSTGAPGWSRKKGRKMVVVWCGVVVVTYCL